MDPSTSSPNLLQIENANYVGHTIVGHTRTGKTRRLGVVTGVRDHSQTSIVHIGDENKFCIERSCWMQKEFEGIPALVHMSPSAKQHFVCYTFQPTETLPVY